MLQIPILGRTPKQDLANIRARLCIKGLPDMQIKVCLMIIVLSSTNDKMYSYKNKNKE